MKKYLLLMACACVAVSAMAGLVPCTQGSGVADGVRIVIMDSHQVKWGNSTDSLLVKNVSCRMGWSTQLLVDEADSTRWVAHQLYEDFDVAMTVDAASGQVSMPVNVPMDTTNYDTQVMVTGVWYPVCDIISVMPESWLADVSEMPAEASITGTIGDDGNIRLDQGFVFLITRTMKFRTALGYDLYDTVPMVSPLFKNVCLMVPNGIHHYRRTPAWFINTGQGSFIDDSDFTLPDGFGGKNPVPIDPRKPIVSTPRPGGLIQAQPYATIYVHDCPVYISQAAGDTTVNVYNLYNSGLMMNYMHLHEDSTINCPGQVIGIEKDTTAYCYNYSVRICGSGAQTYSILSPGNTGHVLPDSICWGMVAPIDESREFLCYYSENVLKYTDGSQFCIPGPMPVAVPGDVDGDGRVNIDDVTLLIDMLLGGSNANLTAAHDVDGSGRVNIDDVTLLIDMLLGNQ